MDRIDNPSRSLKAPLINYYYYYSTKHISRVTTVHDVQSADIIKKYTFFFIKKDRNNTLWTSISLVGALQAKLFIFIENNI